MKTSSPRKLTLSLAVALSIGAQGILRADLGDNNPTGVAGEFNGNVTTGCNYDPYTGNAKRWITDIVVPGAVGAYPLAFTRTINTRTAYPDTWAAPFGRPGGWRHSYQWEPGTINMSFPNCDAGGVPDHYSVTYPDGRVVTFGADGASTTPGIGDRFVPIADPHATSGDCYLLLSDGGRVHFISEITRDCENGRQEAEFVFGCAGIIDPYGQETTIGSTSTPTTFTVIVTEPAGRNLSLCWTQRNVNPACWAIDRVEERAYPNAPVVSRTVRYNYVGPSGTPALDNVVYFDDPRLTAFYTYQASNAGSGNPQLIRTCNDTMYSGAMSKIAYDFAPGQPHGFLLRERYFDGVNAINGPAVSTLAAPNDINRTETRGDGPSRTFTYNPDLGLLMSWTDFQGHPSSQEHYLNASPVGFVKKVIDARVNPTEFGRDSITGKITQITHPPTPSDLSGPGIMEIGYDPNHPYHIASVRNERGMLTTYVRDNVTAEITDIGYPDYHPDPPAYFGHEAFQYNNFGQVKRHQRQNHNYEHMQYDARGLLIYRWNPTASQTSPDAPSTVLPKTTFEYYALDHPWRDRVKTVTDPRGKTTTFEYDRLPPGPNRGPMYAGRGLVSKITYHDNKFVTFDYDARGNTLWEENELRQRTSYTYDDYNRVTEATTPLPEGRTATTTYAYNPTYHPDVPSLSPYLHTARAPTRITTPTGVVVENRYDENGRLKQSTRGPTAPEPATTRYDYDEVGNLRSVKDPRNYETVIENDGRNRRTKVTGPPISAAANIPYVTEWLYDPASNVRKIILADTTEINRDYDEMNRLKTSDLTNDTHQEHRVTLYSYWPSGRLRTSKDPNAHITAFEYDERDLKTKMTYPNQPGSPPILEGWVYDENGNMKERPTIGGPKQSFSYDDRNRLTTMRWSNGIDFSDFGYDEVGRLTSAINPYSSITRHYDDGGRLEFDRQVLATTLNPPSMTITPTGVVSRKSHGSAGSFDINLPLTGAPGIECRIGSNYTLVLTFGDHVSVGGATVNSGIGNVANVTASGNVVTVNLTDVSDAQVIAIRVFGLSDGTNMGELIIPMHVLVGATTGQTVVNADDKEQTDSREGQVANSTNFRSDVNTDGFINSDDVTKVTITAGVDVPTQPAPGPQAEVRYVYDDDGKVKRLYVPTVPDYSYDYYYDGMGRLEWIKRTSNPGAVRYQYAYDRFSNVTGRTSYTNGTSLSFVRDEVNRITEETLLRGDDPLSHLYYTYDSMSRLKYTLHDEDFLLDRFGYNFAGELKSAEYGLHPGGIGGWQNPRASTSYDYDNAGNRFSVNGTTYTPNALNQYIWAQDSPVENGSQHDISSYQGKNYSYLADTQLAGVGSAIGSAPSGDSYRLGYDALGRTVRRTMNGVATYFIYDGAHSIVEYGDSGNMIANTLYGLGVDEIISRTNNGAGQFLMQDRTGSTVAVTGSKGDLLEQYRYDAFGTPEILDEYGNGRPNNESAINNRFLFTGREWVSRFGFYEYRARAYHPGLGRFMSEDPLGFGAGDANLFRYCGNDPVNWGDPFGLWTWQFGLQFSGSIGPFAFAWGGGIAFDGSGNVALYGSGYSATSGLGATIALGAGGMRSDADTISGLEGVFGEGSGTIGDEGEVTLNVFRGKDASGKPVTGSGLFFGGGGGAGWSAGISNTWLSPSVNIFDLPGLSGAPPPGGSTVVDESSCPGCPTLPRVIVTGTFLNEGAPGYNHGVPLVPGYTSGYYGGAPGTVTGSAVGPWLLTIFGIPGGGAQWGEGSQRQYNQ